MENQLFRELVTDLERLNALKTMCVKSENTTITETYDSDEMKSHFDEWREASQTLEQITKSFMTKQAEYKAEKKKLEVLLRKNQEILVHQTFESEQEVYLFPDFSEGRMGIYNSKGDLISTRRLLPDERQQNMFDDRKEGTNN